MLGFFLGVVVLGPVDSACGAEAMLVPVPKVRAMLDSQPKGRLSFRCSLYGRSQSSGMGNCLGVGSNGSAGGAVGCSGEGVSATHGAFAFALMAEVVVRIAPVVLR